MNKHIVYSRFRSPGRKVTGPIFLAGAMGIVLSILTPEVQVAAQTTPGPLSGYGFNPFLGSTFSGTPNTQSLTFDGLVEGRAAPGAYVAIDVLTSPDADFNNEANWIRDVAVVNLSTTTTSQFWSVNKAIFNDTRWPNGGVARYRARWVNPGVGSDLLTHLDTTASAAETAHSIVTDINPAPTANTTIPDYLNALDNRRGFPHYTASQAADQKAATEAYYKGILINADGTGAQAFTNLATLDDFKARYGFNGGQTIYKAKYYNKGDLGIGRDMNCVFNPTTQENACYVSNFAPKTLSDKVVFGDAAGSKQIMLNNEQPFATVAMVERDRMPTTAWNRTFFIVYGPPPDSNIFTGPVALDNKGYNTFVPGNCMVCHGGGGTYDAATNKLKHAYFLPFDQDAFEYLSTDSTNPLSREALHDTFRSMNEEVYFSGLWFLPTAKMVRAWYQDNFGSGQFNGLELPTPIVSDWSATQNSTNVYKYVYAKACRTCHMSNFNSTLAFNGWTEWKTYAPLINFDICGAAKKMPNAEQTLTLGWEASPSPRAYFLGHTPGVTGACNP